MCMKLLTRKDMVVLLQDVVSHNKKLTNKKNKLGEDELTMGGKQGIKGLSKDKRKKLETYQHLFYLLQVSSHVLHCRHTSAPDRQSSPPPLERQVLLKLESYSNVSA